MADRIGVWAVSGQAGHEVAQPLEELQSAETEQRLEELLVASPAVLMPDLTLVGRQIQTSGGPLDLLGVDQDGRLVLFELKRGTLTRDAVAQILDYGSDLREREPEDLARLVQQNSGRLGIQVIDDFTDWYRSEFPDVDDMPPAGLRLVLVGLGVDDRARRMVNFLAESGIDIQLLTFQAFRKGTETFLARHVETVAPAGRRASSAGGTKETNRRSLEDLADTHGVKSLFLEVADFIESKLPSYRWPGKSGFTYSLQEMTEQGRPSLRAYAWLGVGSEPNRRVLLQLPARAIDVANTAVSSATAWSGVRRDVSRWIPFELAVTPESWPAIREPMGELLSAVAKGWKEKLASQKQIESMATEPEPI